jgi:hypothetical protein
MKVKDLIEKEIKVNELLDLQKNIQLTLDSFDEIQDQTNNVYLSGISISGWPLNVTDSKDKKEYKQVVITASLAKRVKSKIRLIIEEELVKVENEINSIEI